MTRIIGAIDSPRQSREEYKPARYTTSLYIVAAFFLGLMGVSVVGILAVLVLLAEVVFL